MDWTDALRCASRPPSHRRRPIPRIYANGPFALFLGRVPMWKVALAVAAALAAVALLAVLAGAVFLLLAPVVLLAALAHRFFGAGRRRGRDGRVIEGEYVAVEEERVEIEVKRRRKDGRRPD
jgi:membrane protein implicated in regulation of membrane protease activity